MPVLKITVLVWAFLLLLAALWFLMAAAVEHRRRRGPRSIYRQVRCHPWRTYQRPWWRRILN